MERDHTRVPHEQATPPARLPLMERHETLAWINSPVNRNFAFASVIALIIFGVALTLAVFFPVLVAALDAVDSGRPAAPLGTGRWERAMAIKLGLSEGWSLLGIVALVLVAAVINPAQNPGLRGRSVSVAEIDSGDKRSAIIFTMSPLVLLVAGCVALGLCDGTEKGMSVLLFGAASVLIAYLGATFHRDKRVISLVRMRSNTEELARLSEFSRRFRRRWPVRRRTLRLGDAKRGPAMRVLLCVLSAALLLALAEISFVVVLGSGHSFAWMGNFRLVTEGAMLTLWVYLWGIAVHTWVFARHLSLRWIGWVVAGAVITCAAFLLWSDYIALTYDEELQSLAAEMELLRLWAVFVAGVIPVAAIILTRLTTRGIARGTVNPTRSIPRMAVLVLVAPTSLVLAGWAFAAERYRRQRIADLGAAITERERELAEDGE